MIYILTVTVGVLLNLLAAGQLAPEPYDAARIMLNSYLPDQTETLSSAARSNLYNKLNQISSANGVAGSPLNPRFILTAKVDVLGKEITPTAPPLHAYTLGITFYIGDGLQGNLYSNLYKEVKGVGRSESKAYMQALRNINPREESFTEFIEEGKEKIIGYYTTECARIIKKANMLADQKKHDAALYELMSIPGIVYECHDKAMTQATIIYKSKIEHECQLNLSKSKTAAASNNWDKAISYLEGYTPDIGCYEEARRQLDKILDSRCSSRLAKAKSAWASRDANAAVLHLARIPMNSACGNEAQQLAKEIGTTLDTKKQREMDLKLKESAEPDTISTSPPDEQNIPQVQESGSQNIQLAAARDIAFAYSELQNENIIYDVKDWW